ncbi:MAG: Gfo/Idh/MocA family protein [Planctomycetota bacterium]
MQRSLQWTRRSFLKKTGKGAASLAAASALAPQVLGAKSANETIGVGFIGMGVRAGTLIDQVAGCDQKAPGRVLGPGIEGAKVVAVCEVYKPHLEKGVERSKNPQCKRYADYHDLLADPNVDVVVIGTPDHWHSQMLIDAARAGKDVYIEKGWTRTIDEAKRMRAAVKQSGIVMQLGHQGRELAAAIQAGELIRQGLLGHVHLVNTTRYTNNTRQFPNWRWYGWYTDFNRPDPNQVVRDLDWHRWLGPAPKVPFSMEHFWHWRCYWNYGTGTAGDLLSHELDYVQSVLGYGIPDTCMTMGHVNVLQDGRECPDTWHTVYHFDDQDCTVTFESCMNTSARTQPIQFRGKEAVLVTNDIGQSASAFDVYAEKKSAAYGPKIAAKEIPADAPFVSFDPTKTPAQPSHMQDFFNCVRSRGKPKANEDEAFIEAATFIMAYVSLRERRMVRWDREKEEIVVV